MASLNRVLLIGNCTRDPELRHTPKGTAIADLGLAINRVLGPAEEGGDRREEVVFVDVTLWGRQAEIAQQYLTKGRSVFIEGRLQLDQWDDKQMGQKRSRLKVVGEHLQLLGTRPANGPQGEAPEAAAAPAAAAPSTRPASRPSPGRPQPARGPALPENEPDDIPF